MRPVSSPCLNEAILNSACRHLTNKDDPNLDTLIERERERERERGRNEWHGIRETIEI